MTELIEKLSEFGRVQICTAKQVFTLLMTGKGLDKMSTGVAIHELVTDAVARDYPNVENIRNGESFYCIVLSKPYRVIPSDDHIEAIVEQISIQPKTVNKVSILKSYLQQYGNY